MAKIYSYLKLIRVANALMIAFATFIGAFSGRGNLLHYPNYLYIILAILSTFLFSSAANVLNDYLDIETDSLNHPDRPLPSKEISLKTAKYLFVSFFILGGLAILLTMNIYLYFIYLLAFIMIILYEFKYKNEGIVGNILISLLTALLFIYGGVSIHVIIMPLILSIPAFFATLCREISKDIEDIKGDIYRITYPKKYGIKKAKALATYVMVASIVLGYIPILLKVFSLYQTIFYILFIVLADIAFAYSLFVLNKNNFHKAQIFMKYGMAIVFIAYLLSAV